MQAGGIVQAVLCKLICASCIVQAVLCKWVCMPASFAYKKLANSNVCAVGVRDACARFIVQPSAFAQN